MSHPWVLFGLILMYASLTGITFAEISSDQNDTSQSGCIFGYDILNTTNNSLPLKEKISDMTTFVKKGVTYAKNNSKESTLAAFNDVKGDFVKGEQYLFAYDINGTTLALPYQQEIIGTNRKDLVDSNGMAFIKALTYLAGYGGGYLYYVYPNPAKNLTPQVKFAYVEPVDDTWFVGSGIYLPNIDAFRDKKAISGLVDRVNRSAAFAEKAGKEKASASFNDKNDIWANNNTYIFAYDYNGTTLAMPYQPESIGTNRWNYTDTYGSPIARLEIDIAKAGGGFVYVVYYNPESGRNELKFCYVVPVQKDWMVGSGIYTGEDLSDSDSSS